MNQNKKAMLTVNFAVLLFGLAGLFAKWIQLPSIAITFGRVFFSSITLLIVVLIRREKIRLNGRKDYLLLFISGCVLALHWWSFLASIQKSTVAIGTITFSTFPLFVILAEPILFHQKLKIRKILMAMIILLGVFITIPQFSLENTAFQGILLGMFSSMAYAALTLLNKNFTNRYSGTIVSFYEQSTAAVVLLPVVLQSHFSLNVSDLGLLILLGVFTTALAHTLFISSLKYIQAGAAGIVSSMETVYGILFAFLFLQEIPTVREIIGGICIVGVVTFSQFMDIRENKMKQA